MTQDLREKMARGAAWMVLFKLLDRSIGFGSTLILARLLTPENFGIVAMATSLIAMLELIAAFGFDMALIQRADATRAHYDTAWTLSVILGCVLSFLMVALSWPIAHFYNQPALVSVICALAIGSLLQGFQNVGTVAFRKDLEFHKEFRFLVSKRIATVPITIGLAFLLRNYWALIAGMVTGRVVDLFLSYRFHPYRPRFNLSALGDLLHFSKWLLLMNALQFLRDRSPDFVIGRIAGANALGIFSVSHELASLPGTELVAPINRAVYPVYVRVAGDRAALQREYLAVIAMICLLAIPAVAGIAATASLLVPLALGPQWLSAIPILQVLAFFGITQVMHSNDYAVCLALARGDLFSKLSAANVAILVTLLVVLVYRYGVLGAAYAYLSASIVMLPVFIAVILRLLHLSVLQFVAWVWRPLLSAFCMFVVVTLFSRDVAPDAPLAVIVPKLAGAVALGAFVYIAVVVLAWWMVGKPQGAESAILGKIRPIVSRLRTRIGV